MKRMSGRAKQQCARTLQVRSARGSAGSVGSSNLSNADWAAVMDRELAAASGGQQLLMPAHIRMARIGLHCIVALC